MKKPKKFKLDKKLVKMGYKVWNASDYLTSEEMIAEYLTAALEEPNPEVFVLALENVAKARGMAKVAKDAGLGRESLYKALSKGSHPRYETISAVMQALGVKFAVESVAR
jgi:probable addiction module antidote protein